MSSQNLDFPTLNDAKTHVFNAGIGEWGLDEERLAEFLYRHGRNFESFNDALKGFLTKEGLDPADFSL